MDILEISPSGAKTINDKKEVTSLLPYLNYEAYVAEGTIFDDIFQFIIQDKDIFSIIFSGVMGNHSLDPFIEQYHKPSEIEEDEIDYLEIYWSCDYFTYKGEDTIRFDPEFHADSYSLSFIPINELKKHNIKLNKEVTAYYQNLDDRDISENPTFVANKSFTVYDIIKAILYEITWHGAPRNFRCSGKTL